jgi:hypothetical protein
MLSTQERIVLLAQMNVVRPTAVLNEAAQRAMLATKGTLLSVAGKATRRFWPTGSEHILDFNRATDWSSAVLPSLIERESERLSHLSDDLINAGIRRHLIELAGTAADLGDAELSEAVVAKAAHSLRLDADGCSDSVSLEGRVFEEGLREIIPQIQAMLRKIPATESQNLERLLRAEIEKLSPANREAMRKALHIDELSARALISVLKSGSALMLTQVLVGGFGFGAFLFLATTMKAIGLLIGTTFAFGTYTAASSFLSFLLSGPFFVLVVLASGGVALWNVGRQIELLMARTLIIVGRGRFLAASASAALATRSGDGVSMASGGPTCA